MWPAIMQSVRYKLILVVLATTFAALSVADGGLELVADVGPPAHLDVATGDLDIVTETLLGVRERIAQRHALLSDDLV